MANFANDSIKGVEKLREEMHEIQELLGRIHSQKNWYRPKDRNYVGG